MPKPSPSDHLPPRAGDGVAAAPATAMGDDVLRAVARRLEEVRERTLTLIAPVDWPLLRKQHIPILSPMVWDLGHIGNFEEMWLLERPFGETWLRPEYERMFDAVENPRPTREALPLPERGELFGYLARVREKVMARLHDPGALARDPRLLRDGFVYELVAEHEEQHQETLLQAMQAMDGPFYQPALRRSLPAGPRLAADATAPGAEMVTIPAGPFLMGRDVDGGKDGDGGFAYDNEQGAHEVDLPAYRIDVTPVTNRAYRAFVADGGYERRELWGEEGWQWRQETGAEAPLYWLPPGEAAPEGAEVTAGADADRWRVRRFGRIVALDPAEPVMHVSYWEARAYARWAGKRLPTEAEWETAALWDPRWNRGAGRSRAYPWGDEAPGRGGAPRANVDQLAFGPSRVGAYPAGVSAYGLHNLVGDVWEWTASDFTAYPGFAAYPYPEYSEIFCGDEYKVLRGGSWATRPRLARGTFRNWDFPIRRQIFSGFRCAGDA